MPQIASAADIRMGESPASAAYLGDKLCWQRVSEMPLSLLTLRWVMGGLTYSSRPDGANAENCVCTLYSCDKSIAGDYMIPRSIDGIPVNKIQPYCFLQCDGLTSVIIEDNIIEFGVGVFRECAGLRSVVINTNAPISSEMFFDCPLLQSVSFASSVEYSSADLNCYQFSATAITSFNAGPLGNVVAKKGLYGSDFFSANTAITEIVFPPDFAPYSSQHCINYLNGCNSLTTVKIYNPTMMIPYLLFNGLPSLTTVYGYANSTAQDWAESHMLTFIALPQQ